MGSCKNHQWYQPDKKLWSNTPYSELYLLIGTREFVCLLPFNMDNMKTPSNTAVIKITENSETAPEDTETITSGSMITIASTDEKTIQDEQKDQDDQEEQKDQDNQDDQGDETKGTIGSVEKSHLSYI